MTADRWMQIEPLFEAALDQPAGARADWLAAACPDPDLRREVADLLAASEQAAGFLETPVRVFAEDLDGAERRIGPYRIVREIGRGGMGVVYLAERADGQYEQEVAVKVLRRSLDGGERHRRFLAERQILATLQHPNIARLLDGGVTEDGRPYLVMTHVPGRPITEVCRERGLPLRAQLRLFATVCDAVQYAHQQLVVHRDLKPSNILVTEDGEVKLLDFGIAKLLDPGAAGAPPTRTGLHLMTPEYASPEQVRGTPVSTASDVYQLGLLLYELLTGRRAHDLGTHALAEVARVVCEAEPAPPSRSAAGGIQAQQLRGELDAVVATALRKEPERRYASAGQLGDDVRRYLAGLPVTAHADSVGYRLRKFVRRNRIAVGAGVLVALLLVGYAVTVTVQQARTARERDRAERYASFLTDLFDGSNPFTTQELGPETTLRAFLDQGALRVRSELRDDPDLQASLLHTIGGAYMGLGEDSVARALYDEVLPYQRARYGEHSPDYIETLRQRALATVDAGAADSLHRLQVALARAMEGGAGPRTAHGLSSLGFFLGREGRIEEAARVLEEAAGMADGADPETRASVLYFLGQTKRSLDRLAEADSVLREALRLRSGAYGPAHPQTAVIMTELGLVAEARGDLDAALRWKQEALRIFEEELGTENPYTIAQLNNVGVLLGLLGRYSEEEQIYRRVLAWREDGLGPEDAQTVSALQNLGASLLRQGRLDEAEPLFLEVRARYAGSLAPAHYLHAFPSLSLADLYLQRRAFPEAEGAARLAASHLSTALPEGHPLVGVALSRQGEAVLEQGRLAEAESLLVRGHALLEAAEGFDTYHANAARRLVALDEARGSAAVASSLR